MWLETINDDNDLVTQARFAGVKIFHRDQDHGWSETAHFNIQHTGFCKGYLETGDEDAGDVIMVAPSDTDKIMISKLVETFIRPIVTLVRGNNCGTVMCVRQWSGMECKYRISPSYLYIKLDN